MTLSPSLITQRFRRIHARCAPARVERGEERERECHQRDGDDVPALQIRWQLRDEVHVFREELDAERVLDRGHDHVDVERGEDAAPTPPAVPMMPISMPCTTKICMIEPGRAPRVRRMAMSACLSVTATTSVEMMLIAATRMISPRMMNIMRFSISTARKKLAWLRVQSEAKVSSGILTSSSRATVRAAKRSSSFRRTPVTDSPSW